MLKQCTSCETIFSKTNGCRCEACCQGDYSDHFKSGNLIDINPKDMFNNGASVYMCPKCMTYTRTLPNGESSIVDVESELEDQSEITSEPIEPMGGESSDDDEIVKHFNNGRNEPDEIINHSTARQYCSECESEMVHVKR